MVFEITFKVPLADWPPERMQMQILNVCYLALPKTSANIFRKGNFV